MTLCRAPKLIFTASLLIGLTLATDAQRVVTNSAGDRVLIYPDGSWRYAEEADSTLLRNDPYQMEMPLPNERDAMSEADRYELMLREWTNLYADISEEKIQAQIKFRDATNAQFKAREELQNAEANKNLIEPDQLARYNETFEQSVKDLKKAKKQQRSIRAILENADQVNSFLSKLQEKKVDNIRKKYNQYLKEFAPQTDSPVAAPPKGAAKPKSNQPESLLKDTEGQVISSEMINARPVSSYAGEYIAKPYHCAVTKKEDPTGQQMQTSTTSGVLFTFTDNELRPYFKDKDLMTCTARLTKTGPYVYLIVEFQIASSHSRKNFGALLAGSLLRLQLMNETMVSLYNATINTGKIDAYTGHTIFTGQYALGKKDLRALKKSGLNKMRVMWSTGFEDYDIYHIDLLIHQIKCLEDARR